ncbi:MAG: putative quinol monooxygenase [Solirubrobacteraceae bacterium]
MSHDDSVALQSMLIVAGHLEVHESDRDRYVADCAAAVAAARSADGCLDFAVCADAVDPRRVNVFERWRTRESLNAFRGGGPDAGMRRRILGASIAEYDIE